MQALTEKDWSNVFITTDSVTYGDVIYRVNVDHPHFVKGKKAYFWNEQCNVSAAPQRKIYENCTVQRLKQTTSMIAVCQKRNQDEFCFLIKPSPSTRKVHLVRMEKKQMIKEVLFVTNHHILVQFDHQYVPQKMDKNHKMIAEKQSSDSSNHQEFQSVVFQQNGEVVS